MIRFVPRVEAFAIALDAVAASSSRLLLFDDRRPLHGVVTRFKTGALIGEVARTKSPGNVGIDLRTATKAINSEQAQLLVRGRRFTAAFPRVTTHAQSQLAMELAARGVDVIVSSERAAFEQLIDESRAVRRLIPRRSRTSVQ